MEPPIERRVSTTDSASKPNVGPNASDLDSVIGKLDLEGKKSAPTAKPSKKLAEPPLTASAKRRARRKRQKLRMAQEAGKAAAHVEAVVGAKQGSPKPPPVDGAELAAKAKAALETTVVNNNTILDSNLHAVKAAGTGFSAGSLPPSSLTAKSKSPSPLKEKVAVPAVDLGVEAKAEVKAKSPSPVVAPVKAKSPSPAIAQEKAKSPSPVAAPVKAKSPSPVVAPVQAKSPSPALAQEKAKSPSPVVAPVKEKSPSPALAQEKAKSPSPVVAPVKAKSPSPDLAPVKAKSPSPALSQEKAKSPSPALPATPPATDLKAKSPAPKAEVIDEVITNVVEPGCGFLDASLPQLPVLDAINIGTALPCGISDATLPPSQLHIPHDEIIIPHDTDPVNMTSGQLKEKSPSPATSLVKAKSPSPPKADVKAEVIEELISNVEAPGCGFTDLSLPPSHHDDKLIVPGLEAINIGSASFCGISNATLPPSGLDISQPLPHEVEPTVPGLEAINISAASPCGISNATLPPSRFDINHPIPPSHLGHMPHESKPILPGLEPINIAAASFCGVSNATLPPSGFDINQPVSPISYHPVSPPTLAPPNDKLILPGLEAIHIGAASPVSNATSGVDGGLPSHIREIREMAAAAGAFSHATLPSPQFEIAPLPTQMIGEEIVVSPNVAAPPCGVSDATLPPYQFGRFNQNH